MNSKGFTLIELLSVIVILLSISVIAISSISAAIGRNKERENQIKIEVIINYAKLWYEENKYSTRFTSPGIGNEMYNKIFFDDIDLLDSEIPTDDNGLPICGYVLVNNGTFTFVEDLYSCRGVTPVN